MSAKTLMPVLGFTSSLRPWPCCLSLDAPKGYSYNGLALAQDTWGSSAVSAPLRLDQTCP